MGAIEGFARREVTADEVAFIAPRGPGRGQLVIRVDRGRPVTVDLAAERRSWRDLVAVLRLGPGTHTIVVRAGTANDPAARGRVELDAIVTLVRGG